MPAAATRSAARLVAGGAAAVAGSVLADSAMEHYRGSFDSRAMLLPIASSALAIAADSRLASGRVTPASPLTASIHAASIAVGAAGLGFHAYNVTRKAGGISWNNLFYRAPIGAPAALVTSGMLGVAAQALVSGASYLGPLPLLSGRALAGFTALGLAGASAETALLHFRGAYHDPFMWLPVTLPPLSAAALARAAMTGRAGWITTATLAATAAVGLFGMAFHAYGVSRNMGGWKNWRQNILAGPPLPAPPSFTGLAIAGLGALMLIRRFARG